MHPRSHALSLTVHNNKLGLFIQQGIKFSTEDDMAFIPISEADILIFLLELVINSHSTFS